MTFDAPTFLEALFSPAASVPSPCDLPPEWFERWEERASIMEYDGGLAKEEADAKALEDIHRQMQTASVPVPPPCRE